MNWTFENTSSEQRRVIFGLHGAKICQNCEHFQESVVKNKGKGVRKDTPPTCLWGRFVTRPTNVCKFHQESATVLRRFYKEPVPTSADGFDEVVE